MVIKKEIKVKIVYYVIFFGIERVFKDKLIFIFMLIFVEDVLFIGVILCKRLFFFKIEYIMFYRKVF